MTNQNYILAPIPFDDRLRDLALELKNSGLPWSPHVGCFVWDHHGFISTPSPFPKGIYFILSIKRFLKIFGDVEQMKERLVWLPTWYQAMQVCQQLQISRSEIDRDGSGKEYFAAEDELIRLYRVIAQKLKESMVARVGDHRTASDRDENDWVRRVMESELGGVTHLPFNAQRRIETVYREIAKAYLGWRRVQEHQSEDWFPQESRFDSTLLGELGHFYSDYQHQVKSLEMIRRIVDLIKASDPSKDPHTYDQLINALTNYERKEISNKSILEQLTVPIDTPADP